MYGIAWGFVLLITAAATAQEAGSIRGVVYDRDFDAPLPLAQVTLIETGATVTATEQGNFLIPDVPVGVYTLVFSKDGYTRQVRTAVVVSAGQMTEVEASLSGEFTELDEFTVQDLQIGGATEAGLLRLRLDVPQLLDSISADLMSRAGVSDAASALRLVAGASVQEGKFAVIRGLPDRYVNSQLNGIRLPTADENKRAVQLDQFPAAVIESIQVSKTFTPDQQGDASGGAVNVILKGIPDENILQWKGQLSFNTQAGGRDDFLTYPGGGVNFWGRDDSRALPIDGLFGGAAGVSRGSSPTDYKWSAAAGASHVFDTGVKIGGFASFFYERDSSFDDNGVDDSWWVTSPGSGLEPRTLQEGSVKTALFDVTKATKSVQWGGLATFGIETENHSVNAAYLHTRIAEDTATLAEDTRGKEYFFPNYDPNDPTAPSNTTGRDLAPYLRTETLQYTERTTTTFQLRGEHTLPIGDWGWDDVLTIRDPIVEWRWADSEATQYQPDKRQFGSFWLAESFNPGFPPFLPAFTEPAVHLPFKPAENFLLGNFQRIWKDIEETSSQYAIDLKIPFEQWTGDEGYIKLGVFDDVVERHYNQDSFSNFNDATAMFQGDWEEFWSAVFPLEDHPITDGPPFVDVDYRGDQHISAFYAMADVPVTSWLNVIGGARFESTRISIENTPEANAVWFPQGATAGVLLLPGDADVDFEQDDVLPSIGFVLKPFKHITLRGSYSETVARQTFKELTPILQQEFLGSDVFIGNPFLTMSALKNYDLRLDYAPYEGSLFSVSWFYKDVTDPIEYVQRVTTFTYTTPVNYPEGLLAGIEVEVRQDLGRFWDRLHGLSIGANATFIDSEVTLPEEESEVFAGPTIQVPLFHRDMTNTPEYLYNLFLTYDIEATGTQLALFYTVQGDTLVAGAGQSSGNFVPSIYATEYDTLNFTVSQRIGKYVKLQFQAKNLTNSPTREVYRSEFAGPDVVRTSYTSGIELAVGLSAEIPF
jgi:outer membrane receptor protein involved in Fe transport